MNKDLIRDHLLEHSRSVRNGCFPKESDLRAKITNPLCGDHVELRLCSDGDIIQDIGFKASGCAICSASASILVQVSKNQKVQVALEWISLFEKTLADSSPTSWPFEIRALSCFEHIRVTPSRRMCALLPWVVLRSALLKAEAPLSP